jgi:pyruvate dehydrogenase E2 component (dihydrolipoamide acetyltransferase)
MAEFRMPSLGADMDEGTLTEWLVKPGDEVHKGDIIAVIDTAKSAIEVESFHTGTVDRLIVPVGETVPVGTVLATITQPEAEAAATGPAQPVTVAAEPVTTAAKGEAPPKVTGEQPSEAASPLIRRLARRLGVDLTAVRGTGGAGEITQADVRRAAAAPQPAPAPAPVTGEKPGVAARQPVTPLARRLAAELGVDLAAVPGTGPGGAVREGDVRRAAAARQPTAPAAPLPQQAPERAAKTDAERALAMRQAIGRLMARSKREIPHYYLSNTVDLTTAMNWLHERNRELPVAGRLVPAALLLKAAALALRQVPELNGYWQDDHFNPGDGIHLGVAISLRGGGLVTPAIHAADGLTLAELMASLKDLVTRARAGRLRRAELTEATITVTNLGDQGVEAVFGVIYPPQVALVGVGRVAERPFAMAGLIGARPVVVTTLSADHRATDGFTGARYLTMMADLLQRPEDL